MFLRFKDTSASKIAAIRIIQKPYALEVSITQQSVRETALERPPCFNTSCNQITYDCPHTHLARMQGYQSCLRIFLIHATITRLCRTRRRVCTSPLNLQPSRRIDQLTTVHFSMIAPTLLRTQCGICSKKLTQYSSLYDSRIVGHMDRT